ncbi:hypothetical protein [Thermotoga sp. SG1]|uniref:hypothetical protein n=1 Tax=Thermotoga sp. SG1 TaxID=126739 RepID=UPI000CC0B170|nr:hypothetical protein [Thermotoga sp. SG1]PLV56056.1 hypothetical protein AS006_05685 [Thermotoga sp. SG1]
MLVIGKGRDKLEVVMEVIDRFEKFLRSIGCPTRLSELGIGEITEDMLYHWTEKTLEVLCDEKGRLPGVPPFSKDDIVEILKMAIRTVQGVMVCKFQKLL